jgi:hypothetical protein
MLFDRSSPHRHRGLRRPPGVHVEGYPGSQVGRFPSRPLKAWTFINRRSAVGGRHVHCMIARRYQRRLVVPGSYVAEISRADPGCLLFLVDRSGSMNGSFAGDLTTSKADAAADAINKLLMSVILRCTQNVGEGPRNYFDVGVVGYGSNSGVGSCLGGALRGRGLVSVAELADNYMRLENRTRRISDGIGGMAEAVMKYPVWIDPVAEGAAQMREALLHASDLLEPWVASHESSYPPIVVNITDGVADADPASAAGRLTRLRTSDGTVLFYNVHLSSLAIPPILFPSSLQGVLDPAAQMLFEMSAVVPRRIAQELELEGYVVTPGARGFVFNADATALIGFLDIGTRLVLSLLSLQCNRRGGGLSSEYIASPYHVSPTRALGDDCKSWWHAAGRVEVLPAPRPRRQCIWFTPISANEVGPGRLGVELNHYPEG